MSAPLISSGIIFVILIFSLWVIWIYLYEKVSYTNETLRKKYLFKVETIEIDTIIEIKYHYDAVVGFTSVWEFFDKSGKSLNINGKARGISKTLLQLESALNGFSMKNFKQQFEAGDVVDTLDIWSKKVDIELSTNRRSS